MFLNSFISSFAFIPETDVLPNLELPKLAENDFELTDLDFDLPLNPLKLEFILASFSFPTTEEL